MESFFSTAFYSLMAFVMIYFNSVSAFEQVTQESIENSQQKENTPLLLSAN